ncbi:hypothetical protein HID58_025589, partial [Brassica napus]
SKKESNRASASVSDRLIKMDSPVNFILSLLTVVKTLTTFFEKNADGVFFAELNGVVLPLASIVFNAVVLPLASSVLSLLWITAKIPAMFGVFDKEMTKLTNKEFVVLALKELPNGGEDELLPLKSLLARSVFQIRVTLYNFTPNHRTFSVSTITEDLIIDNQADVCNLAGESLVFPAFMYTSLSEAAENILPSSEGARGLTASSSGVAVVGKKV